MLNVSMIVGICCLYVRIHDWTAYFCYGYLTMVRGFQAAGKNTHKLNSYIHAIYHFLNISKKYISIGYQMLIIK